MKLGHIERPVRDPVASMAFYVDVLGCDLVANQDDRFIWVDLGSVELLLKPGEPDPAARERRSNLTLYTDTLERQVDALRERGIELHPDGTCFFFQDPDGHWLQLVDPTDHG